MRGLRCGGVAVGDVGGFARSRIQAGGCGDGRRVNRLADEAFDVAGVGNAHEGEVAWRALGWGIEGDLARTIGLISTADSERVSRFEAVHQRMTGMAKHEDYNGRVCEGENGSTGAPSCA